MRNEFSISLEQTGVTNQKQSGRCWMFAALNVLRFGVVKSTIWNPLSFPRTTRSFTISWRRRIIFWKTSSKRMKSLPTAACCST